MPRRGPDGALDRAGACSLQLLGVLGSWVLAGEEPGGLCGVACAGWPGSVVLLAPDVAASLAGRLAFQTAYFVLVEILLELKELLR